MCGRYNLTASSEAIVEHFQLHGQVRFQSSYNIALAQKILNIVEHEDQSKKSVNLFCSLLLSMFAKTNAVIITFQCTVSTFSIFCHVQRI
jgi:putative SOS response-associated peptidase YedK